MRTTDLLVFVLIYVMVIFLTVKADIRRDCRRETKVSWGSLKKMRAGDFSQEDPKLKCYMRCYLVRSGLMNGNAEIDVPRALRQVPGNLQDSSRRIFNRCNTVAGEDACDKAFKIAKCCVRSCPEILHNVPFV